MKRFFIVSAMVLCVISVIGGHFYYNKKLEQTASAAKLELKSSPSKEVSTKNPATKKNEVVNSFSNAPKGVAQLYKKKNEKGESLRLSLVGSESTSLDEGTWANIFKKKMNDTYGKNVEIDVTDFGELTSLEVTNDPKYNTLLEKKSDVVIIEPFLLNDNGEVRLEDTLFILNKIVDDLKTANPDAIVILQPSNPIYMPQIYAEQVSGLEDYAKENKIPYLNFWDSWPSVDSEEVKKYYDKETLLPTKEGHQLWADYIFNVFN
jgi:hypothetical protein